MKAIAGLVLGIVGGLFAFFVLHYQQLLLVGKKEAGLLLTIQLNNAVDMYMFGGAIVGLLFVLIQKESK
jgi:hypothetical protein